MRNQGMSYSRIKEEVQVSNSTLSSWLQDFPLSQEQLLRLRSKDRQIERCRNTKMTKRKARHDNIYIRARTTVGQLAKREIFISGLFLYWAEGTKAGRDVVCLANTDPNMILFFIHWLELQGVSKERLRVRLHLYKDMNERTVTAFWVQALQLPESQFRRPYIKKTSFEKRRNYKGRFGHGTCNLFAFGRDLHESTLMQMKYIRDLFSYVDLPKE